MVNHFGSTEASACEIIMAIGLIPRDLAFSSLIKTTAAAPSLIEEEFAAVAVPSFEKEGLKLGIFSI